MKPRKHIEEVSSYEWSQRIHRSKESPLAFAENMLFLDDYEFQPSYPQRCVLQSTKMNTYVCVHRRAGKAQPLYSKLYNKNGPLPMGEVKVGSTVLTPDGSEATVLDIFPQGQKQIWRVHFDDNTFVDCGEDHLWTVYCKTHWAGGRGASRQQYGKKTLTTLEIKESLTYRYSNRCEFNYKIDGIQPISFSKKDLAIDPYLLGVLLGDGYLRTCTLLSKDFEIIQVARERSKKTIDQLASKSGQASTFVVRDIIPELTKLGLQETLSHTKFIPFDYLYSDKEDRLWLLRGLMDTDGSSDSRRKGQAEYCTVSPQLAEDVATLARSLGCKVKITKSKAGYKKDGIYIPCKDRYRLNIRVPLGLEIFNLERKKCGGLAPRYLRKTIVNVEILNEFSEMQCILIDHPEHLYLTDHFVPTHNTIVEACLLHDTALRYPKARIGVFTGSTAQLDEIFQNFDAFRTGHPILSNFVGPENNNSTPVTRTYDNGSRIEGHLFGTTYDPALIEAKRGKSYDFVFVDETQGLHEEVWRVLGPIISGNQHSKEYKRAWLFGTIVEPAGYFYREIFEEPEQRPKDSVINLIKEIVFVPADKNPDISPELMDTWKSQCSSESVWQTEYLLQPTGTAANVFRPDDIKAAFSGDYEYGVNLVDKTCFRILAVDWDKVQAGTSILIAQYSPQFDYWTVIWREVVPRGDFTLTQAIQRVLQLREEFQVNLIASDSGYGEVQYETMKQWANSTGWGDRIIKINTQGNTKLPNFDNPTEDTAVNTKQLMVQLTRNLIEQRKIKFPKTDQHISQQFYQYKVLKETARGPSYTTENEHFIDTVGFASIAHKTCYYLYQNDLVDLLRVNLPEINYFEDKNLSRLGNECEEIMDNWVDREIW